MTQRVIVFDFDGTCTTPTSGADKTFLQAHQAGFEKLLGKSPGWAEIMYKQAHLLISANPETYGWEINGQIVAPALVDAFVEAQVCAQIILRKMGEDVGNWEVRLNSLYQENYLLYHTVFRPELLMVFRELRHIGTPFYVVTNSDPAKVKKRLEALGDDAQWIGPLVRGFAKKFMVTPGPKNVPECMFFPGLHRPVKLRREHYYNVLTQIMDVHQIDWNKLLVVGDIAELDLSLPVAMGSSGHLILGPNTPIFEKEWAENHPHVQTVHDLRQGLI